MGLFYLILALLIQNSYTETRVDSDDNQRESSEILEVKRDGDDLLMKEYHGSKEWMDLFIGTDSKIFPTSSAALMAQATLSKKSPEEQLEDIKDMAEEISKALQNEMANLLTYAISITDDDKTDNKLRKKRSVETPMDSTQLVMRLLKHIKSNNEYQNIAIEKMMTAQEIADKYDIQFNPDPEILSDLAVAANEQAKEMSDILKDSLELKNNTKNKIPATKDIKVNTQYIAGASEKNNPILNSSNDSNKVSKVEIHANQENPDSFSYYNRYFNHPIESQIVTPPHYHQIEPVSPRPSFYEYISYEPQEFLPYCSMDFSPVMDNPTEPELAGEEIEEIVSSKVSVDHEPGWSTVNHVTTYTVSEKAHYRTPQIENLPQQMQYYFYLM